MSLSETELAAEVVAHLERADWDVFGEVTVSTGRRVDIVAKSKTIAPMVLVVETKLQLSWDLLLQAVRWKPYADTVYVAVPWAPESDVRRFTLDSCRKYFKVGVIEVGGEKPIVIHDAPVLARLDDELLHAIRPEHKTFAKPGSPGGSGHFTAFGGTEQALVAYVADNPQCKLSEAVAAIKHHYRSNDIAEKALEKAIKKGQIAGVKWMGWRSRIEATHA
jgi:hypothetical protein